MARTRTGRFVPTGPGVPPALVGATEPLADLGLVDVRLGSLAALGANFFLALAAIRLGLFGRDLGTSSAAYVTAVPMRLKGGIFPVAIAGEAHVADASNSVGLRTVTPEYFETMGIPLHEGRDVAARLSVKLDKPVLTNNVEVDVDGDTVVATTPIFGGTQLVRTKFTGGGPHLVLVRPKSFEAKLNE